MLTLAVSALAGEITTMIVPPSSAPTQGEMSTPVNGDMHTDVAGEMTTMNSSETTAGDSLTGAALSVLQDVLSLF
jgi:hypothetical protein